MLAYIKKRGIGLLFVLIGVTIFSFFLANISPVDPAEAFARRNSKIASEEQIERLREEMGFNLPIHMQYLRWIIKVLKGDFGTSLTTGNPVIKEIGKAFPSTLKLVGAASLIIILTVVPMAVIAVVYRDGFFDNLIRIITLLGISIPSFWLGFALLYYFAVILKIVPVVGYEGSQSIILPAITLATPMVASSIRLLRANMLENIDKDFVIYAKARGISDRRILWKHVLKNSMPPIITLFGQTIGYMIAGTAIVESVFSWSGLGNYMLRAIIERDLPAINALVLIMALIFVVFNLGADLINIYIDPRIFKESRKL